MGTAFDHAAGCTRYAHCLTRANHQHLVTTFHLAGGKYRSQDGTLMASVTTPSATLEPTALADRRWLVLVVAAVAQLMLVLDGTIVNIALPSAQQALGFSNSDRQWVVTAYALSFGSLLLVGGRMGHMC